MQQTERTNLTHTSLFLPMFVLSVMVSGCDESNGSSSARNQPANQAPEDNQPSAITSGTVAVSPEALFDFLYVASRFEFWNCASSDAAENTYIALDLKDDDTDEGFNPLLLMGLLREPQLAGDPRALNKDEIADDLELETMSVSFIPTGSDSISMTLHAGDSFTPGVDDTVIILTEVRTGPGRAFTAEDQLNNLRLTCKAGNVGANVML